MKKNSLSYSKNAPKKLKTLINFTLLICVIFEFIANNTLDCLHITNNINWL